MATRSIVTPARSFSAAQLGQHQLQRRAIEAAVWGMPIVSFDAMRKGFFGVGAKYGDIAYLSKPADWRFRITTPNSSSLYVYFNFNLQEGPLVLDFPAAVGAGLFGSIMDAWQAPVADVGPAGDDQGKGGKYLLLPPDFKGEAPPGYFPLRFATCNGYAAFRAIPKTRSDEDTAKATSLVKQLRIYPLSQAPNPPQQRHIDIAGKHFDGIAKMDDTFFDSLAKMVNEEPVQIRDLVAMGQLRSIGIEKGKEFEPDRATRATLKRAMDEAHASFMDAATAVTPYWPGAKSLDGGKSYHLRVPPNVPAKQFWAVTVYDLETAAFIRESPRTEANSYQDLQKNADASVDIFFGPKAPSGKDSNWIYTAPGKQWVAFFRFYGPEPAIRDKTWVLNDIEKTR